MPNPAILIGLAIIFVCGWFILLHPQTQEEQRPEDDNQIVETQFVSLDEYEAMKRKKRASLISIIVAVILAIILRYLLV